ncbi:hypothetical protein EJB05_38124, partial [Eragrostis curvula]
MPLIILSQIIILEVTKLIRILNDEEAEPANGLRLSRPRDSLVKQNGGGAGLPLVLHPLARFLCYMRLSTHSVAGRRLERFNGKEVPGKPVAHTLAHPHAPHHRSSHYRHTHRSIRESLHQFRSQARRVGSLAWRPSPPPLPIRPNGTSSSQVHTPPEARQRLVRLTGPRIQRKPFDGGALALCRLPEESRSSAAPSALSRPQVSKQKPFIGGTHVHRSTKRKQVVRATAVLRHTQVVESEYVHRWMIDY